MPIHLPPISRRRFFSTSLLAGAGLLLFRRGVLGAEQPVDEHCWALISDTHVAADRATIYRDANMANNLKAVALEVTGKARRPVGALHSGDCAFHSGELTDYATLTELLRPMREAGIDIHLTLGNHDERQHFWAAAADAKATPRPLADHHVAFIETPRANWFVLDSLEKTLSSPGFLGATQLEWLAHALDAHPDKPALVVGHHNLGGSGKTKSALKDSAELLKIIRPRPQVKAYIFGHTHRWHTELDESGIHLVNLPPVGYVFDKAQPVGWVRANLEVQGARLEMSCLDRTHKAHGQIVHLDWRKV